MRGPASGAKEEREFPQDPPGVLPGDERLTGRVLTLPGALRNPAAGERGHIGIIGVALGPAPPTAQTLNHPQVLDLKRTSRASPPLQRPSQGARDRPKTPKRAQLQHSLQMARPGLEPGTPRFSVVWTLSSKSAHLQAKDRVVRWSDVQSNNGLCEILCCNRACKLDRGPNAVFGAVCRDAHSQKNIDG